MPGESCYAGAMIELKGVTKAFDGRPVLRGVSLSLADGTLTALVGGSGAGKTTLLKTINALVTPDSGSVVIDNVPTAGVEPHALRRSIGYVFQDVGLFAHMTVAQNIGVTPKLLGLVPSEIDERVLGLLKLVGLPADFATRLPDQLSGGQRQRVGVARALAAAPHILLMDEPFGALDPISRVQLADDFARLHRRLHLTTIMVTHDIAEAALMADRIVVLADGEVIADAPPAALLKGHVDPRVTALFEAPRRQALRLQEIARG
jgi:osmoprotectant transport system ATP-binding protein